MQRIAPLLALAFVFACDKGGDKKKTAEPEASINVKIPPPVYLPDSKAPKKVVDKCKFDSRLAESIVGMTPGASISAGGSGGKVLNMEIVSMRGVDPESQGERIVIVRGDLQSDGSSMGTFRARYTAQGALVGGMGGVCQGLKEIADLMGAGVAEWLRDPKSGAQLSN